MDTEIIYSEDVTSIDADFVGSDCWHTNERVQLADGRKGWYIKVGRDWGFGIFDYEVRIDGRTRKTRSA